MNVAKTAIGIAATISMTSTSRVVITTLKALVQVTAQVAFKICLFFLNSFYGFKRGLAATHSSSLLTTFFTRSMVSVSL
jgi:hypothetical protein